MPFYRKRYRKRPFGRRRLYRKKKFTHFKSSNSRDNQYTSKAVTRGKSSRRGPRVSKGFKKKVTAALSGDRRGCDDTVITIDVSSTPPTNDGEFYRGGSLELFDALSTQHVAGNNDANYVHGDKIRMKGVRIRTWLHNIINTVVDPESEADDAFMGPVDLRFIFFLCKDKLECTSAFANFKAQAAYDLERHNVKYMRKRGVWRPMNTLTTEPTMDEGVLDDNKLRDPRYVHFLCEKRVRIEPIRMQENQGSDGIHMHEGQTVECDWYIPIDKVTKIDSATADPEKWNLGVLVYDMSRHHMGLRLTAATDTFACDYLRPAQWVGLSDAHHKAITQDQAYGATDTDISYGEIEMDVRRYWENMI